MKFLIFLLFSLSVLLLPACSVVSDKQNSEKNVSTDAVAKLWSIARPQVEAFDDRNAAQSLKYASLKVDVDGGGLGTMVLAMHTSLGQQWHSADGFSLTTFDGRFSQFYVPGLDLSRIEISPLFANYNFRAAHCFKAVKAAFEVDNDTAHRFKVLGQAVLAFEGVVQREYWGQPATMLHFTESVSIKTLGFEHTNHYWVLPDSYYVWESEQQWWPTAPLTYYQVLKPWKEVLYP
ncbi:MAG: YjbF family lipoprotein [Thiotrichales bacterium]|nr:YjbF family lipoprotein [Thiotrichales bacterium]